MRHVSAFSLFLVISLVCVPPGGSSSASAAEPATPAAAKIPSQVQAQAQPQANVAGEVVSVDGVVFIRQDGKQTSAALKPAKPGDKVTSGDIVNTSSNGRIKMLMKDKSIVDLGSSALFKVDHFAANAGSDRQLDVSMMYGTMRTAVTQKIDGKGRFKVRTPTATMGVRGTEFIVKSEIKSLDEVKHAIKNPDKPLPSTASAAAGATTAPGDNQAGAGKPSAPPSVAKTEITVIQGQVDVAKPVSKDDKKEGRTLANAPEKVVSLTAGMQLSASGGKGQGETQLSKPVVLDAKQLQTIAQVAKFNDNTFKVAVAIDPANGPGAGTPGGAVLPQLPEIAPPEIVIPLPGVPLVPEVPKLPNAPKHLRVKIVVQ